MLAVFIGPTVVCSRRVEVEHLPVALNSDGEHCRPWYIHWIIPPDRCEAVRTAYSFLCVHYCVAGLVCADKR